MFARRIWGLDLGRSAVKGVLLSATANGVEILDGAIIPLDGEPPDPSQEPIRDGRLWRALRIFKEGHPPGKAEICVAIPAQNTLIRDLSIAAVGTRKVAELVQYEASNEIPFVLDDVVWDYTLFPEQPGQATRSGLLFAVKKNVIHTYVRVFAELGIGHVDRITLAPLALLNFVKLQMGGEGCALAMDVGGENTNMLGVRNGTFWLRNMLTGGNRITDLLREEFELGFPEAEKAKENILRSQYAKQIMGAVTPAIHDLVRNVKTNLSYVERTFGQVDYDATYIVGGGSRLPGVRKQLGSTLRLEIQNISELRRVTVSPKADVEFVRNNLDRLAVAIGAALSGMDQDAANVSFLPKAEARAARISRSRGLMMAAGVAVWLILLTLWAAALWVHGHVAPTLADYDDLYSIHSTNTREYSLARDTRPEEEALQYLLAASTAKDQGVRVFDAVVRAFTQANRSSNYGFRLASYDSSDEAAMRAARAARLAREQAQGEVPEASTAETIEMDTSPPCIVGSIRGRIVLPRGGGAGEAYAKFLTDLLEVLRAQPELVKGKSHASVKKGSTAVESEDAQWLDLVEPGDVVRVLPDGKWCTVSEARSNMQLVLSRPYGAEDAEGDLMISRVLLTNFNEETLEFEIRFEVPRGKPPDVLALIEPKEEG